jgi:hypothetical protein
LLSHVGAPTADCATASKPTFAHATHKTPVEIANMLLVSVAQGQLKVAAKRNAVKRWVYYSGSNACPRCLAETRAWRLQWKLPWFFACTIHNCLAISHCPGCGGRLGATYRVFLLPSPRNEIARVVSIALAAPAAGN